MKNLYVDFDGVICNTIEITYKMAKERGIKKNYENYLQFYQDLDWNEVLEKAEPINNSWNAIQKIINSEKFNVAILTHITSISEAEAKVKLIRNYLPNITIIPVPKSISKTKMIDAKNAILVDDYVYNLEEWKEASGIGVRFDLDMDGKGFPVIDHLDDLIEMF
jgi:uncharacterized protein (DUF1499 family)